MKSFHFEQIQEMKIQEDVQHSDTPVDPTISFRETNISHDCLHTRSNRNTSTLHMKKRGQEENWKKVFVNWIIYECRYFIVFINSRYSVQI